jgi:transposase InsO family protein
VKLPQGRRAASRRFRDSMKASRSALMRAVGLVGTGRGRTWMTTTHADQAASRPPDLVDRQFAATRPNQLWVSDFTYVATWRGFAYVALVIDAFARRIVGWRVSASLRTDFVLDALEQAIYDRARHGPSRRFITATVARSTSRCRTRTAWLAPGSRRLRAAAATRMTMPSPNR